MRRKIMDHQEECIEETPEKKSYEWHAFVFITVFLFPILSVILIGGYGFFIWMAQMFIFGPPGHG